MKVTTKHIFSIPGYSRRPGFCRTGLKAWCQRHGFTPKEFLRGGVEINRLLATNDALALAVVNWAEECEAEKRGQQ